MRLKYNVNLLVECIKRDNSELIEEYKKINSKSRIKFKCGKCKKENEKTFFFIYNYGGAFCKECTLKDKANSMREKYKIKTGYDNPSQNPEIKKKKIETCKKNMGVNYPSQYKDVMEKMKKTYKEKTGYDNPSFNPEVQEKKRLTHKTNTGYDWPGQNPEVKEKIIQSNLKNYGVPFVAQVPSFSEKSIKASYKLKEITTSSGNIIYLQGYEPYAYKILLETYKEEEILNSRIDVPELWWVDDKNKRHRYYVDFYIPKDNLIIEVKSTRTLEVAGEKIHKTIDSAKNAGYKMEVWVLSEKGELKFKLI
jgi:hypothetical protein